MEDRVIDLVGTFFSGIWNGLSTYNVPGTDWSFSGFLIAIFTAGIIGKILKAFFMEFNSHFDRPLQKGAGRSGKPYQRWRKGEELDD